MAELAHNRVPLRRGLAVCGQGGGRERGKDSKRQTETAHHRYPASSTAWRQLRLTPWAVVRQGIDLEVSLVEPLHSLTISREQTLATPRRAAMRFWIASKARR